MPIIILSNYYIVRMKKLESLFLSFNLRYQIVVVIRCTYYDVISFVVLNTGGKEAG